LSTADGTRASPGGAAAAAGAQRAEKIGFDHVNLLSQHEAAADRIDILVNVPLLDGAVAETKIVLEAPLRSEGRAGRYEYSMKVDTDLSVTQVQKKSSGRTELETKDGLWWEIPVGYPGGSTVLLFHEPKVKEFLSSRFKIGGVFVDIGANVGAYSLRAIKSGMRAISFEPNPENVRLLKRNAELNDLSVDVRECALGAAESTVNLSQNGATSRVNDEIKGVMVPVKTLDSFQIPEVDLIKVDVEGYELEVLRGARQTLARTRPPLMIEMHHWIGAEAEAEIFNILHEAGYRFEYLDTYNQGRHLIAEQATGTRPSSAPSREELA